MATETDLILRRNAIKRVNHTAVNRSDVGCYVRLDGPKTRVDVRFVSASTRARYDICSKHVACPVWLLATVVLGIYVCMHVCMYYACMYVCIMYVCMYYVCIMYVCIYYVCIPLLAHCLAKEIMS